MYYFIVFVIYFVGFKKMVLLEFYVFFELGNG